MNRILVVLAAAALAAPFTAHASPRIDSAATGCRKVTVVLQGVVDASPGADFSLPYGLMVDVSSTNAPARAYVKARQPVTVVVGSHTAVSRQGVHTLAALSWGDKVTVAGRICAAELAKGATPTLEASRVTAGPRHP